MDCPLLTEHMLHPSRGTQIEELTLTGLSLPLTNPTTITLSPHSHLLFSLPSTYSSSKSEREKKRQAFLGIPTLCTGDEREQRKESAHTRVKGFHSREKRPH